MHGTESDESTARRLRASMVERQIRGRGISDDGILEAMSEVPRHLFAEGADIHDAYGDHPVAIDFGQTVSQPYIAALLLRMALPLAGRRVLEIGCGSGYLTALLSRIGAFVTALDIIPELCASTLSRLRTLGLDGRVSVIAADGYSGWEMSSPYDAIIVSASPPAVPPALAAQLATGGRLVLPVGEGVQQLLLIKRTESGMQVTPGEYVHFVPLVHSKG